jgi:hypothetical protein
MRINPCFVRGYVSINTSCIPDFDSDCESGKPVIYPIVEQITMCGQKLGDSCGYPRKKLGCKNKNSINPSDCNECGEQEEWKYFESNIDVVNGNKVCLSETKPIYRVKVLPSQDERFNCCTSNGVNETCGGTLCSSNPICDEVVKSHCLTNPNDKTCLLICSKDGAPDWCSDFAQNYCNENNFKTAEICNNFCPLKDPSNRASWCDTTAERYCLRHPNDPFCSCFGPSTIPKVCFNQACHDFGYVSKGSPSDQECKKYCNMSDDDTQRKNQICSSIKSPNIILTFYIVCIIIFLIICLLIFYFK